MIELIRDRKDFVRKFDNRFGLIKIRNPQFDNFLKEIPRGANVYVVGGFLRSVSNHRYRTRDLDIIIDLKNKKLRDTIKKSFPSFVKNRMGGFKISLPNLVLDIWNLENSFAFRNTSPTETKGIRNFSDYSFFNFDSISFDLKNQKINSKYYNQCIVKRELDVVVTDRDIYFNNPKREFLLLRAIYLKKKFGFNLSNKLTKMIVEINEQNSNLTDLLYNCLKEEKKYHNTIRKKDICNFINELKIS